MMRRMRAVFYVEVCVMYVMYCILYRIRLHMVNLNEGLYTPEPAPQLSKHSLHINEVNSCQGIDWTVRTG